MQLNWIRRSIRQTWRRTILISGLSLTLLVSVIVVLFCSTPSLAQSPVSISFMMIAAEASRIQSLVQEFEANNPDIDLNVVLGPRTTNDVEDLYTASFLLGSSPFDLVFADVVWAPKFAAAGWLLDMSDRLSSAEQAEFMSADISAGRVEGGLYWIPFNSNVGMLYYRTDLLEAAGLQPPETVEDLFTVSQALQQQGLVDWGYVWQGFQYEGLVTVFVEMLRGFGGFWVDDATQTIGLDQPESIATAQFLRDTIERGISPPGVSNYIESDSLRLFSSGKVAFLRNWPFVWTEVNRPESAIRGKVGLKAMVHLPGQPSGACHGGWGFGISATTKHPEEAWRVIQFFTREATQQKFVLEQGYVPTRRSVYTNAEVLQKYPHYQQLLAVAHQAVLRPPTRQYAQLSDILQRYLSLVITGQLPAAEAMQKAAQETRQVLNWN